MFALIHPIGLVAAESGFLRFYNDWFNIPGFELWKFINLAIFILILRYLGNSKLKINEKFKARREEIRAELIQAEEDKKAALASLTAIEARLAQLETEKENIFARAQEELADEKARLARETAADIERLRKQVEGDLVRMSMQAKIDLKRFSAEESVRLAEQKLRSRIDATLDARLVKASISEIGGLN